jgi:hypothetical protein
MFNYDLGRLPMILQYSNCLMVTQVGVLAYTCLVKAIYLNGFLTSSYFLSSIDDTYKQILFSNQQESFSNNEIDLTQFKSFVFQQQQQQHKPHSYTISNNYCCTKCDKVNDNNDQNGRKNEIEVIELSACSIGDFKKSFPVMRVDLDNEEASSSDTNIEKVIVSSQGSQISSHRSNTNMGFLLNNNNNNSDSICQCGLHQTDADCSKSNHQQQQHQQERRQCRNHDPGDYICDVNFATTASDFSPCDHQISRDFWMNERCNQNDSSPDNHKFELSTFNIEKKKGLFLNQISIILY